MNALMRTVIMVVIPAVIVALTLMVLFPSLENYEENAFAAQPVDTTELRVEEGKVFAFPWSNANCSQGLTTGCFYVKKISANATTLSFNNFTITKDGSIDSSRWKYETSITKQGSEFVLFNIKINDQKEEWVYAVLQDPEESAAKLKFLKYPAFITKNAEIYREVTLNLDQGSLHDRYKIFSPEEITLLGLNFDRLVPKGEIEQIKLNGKNLEFPYSNIAIINLPKGEHTLDLTINGISTNLCLEPLYEGKKMFLPKETAVRVVSSSNLQLNDSKPSNDKLTISLRTFGLNKEFWNSFDPMIYADPEPLDSKIMGLSREYQFDGYLNNFTFLPIVRYEGYTLPIVACVSH